MQLNIASSAQSEEGANSLWSSLQDHDENYINRSYDKGSMDLFKSTVLRNRSFGK